MWTDLLMYAKFAPYARFTCTPSQDQVQIFVCIIYANFTNMQILSCERKVKFVYIYKFINYAM